MTDYYDNVCFVRGKFRVTGGTATRKVLGDARSFKEYQSRGGYDTPGCQGIQRITFILFKGLFCQQNKILQLSIYIHLHGFPQSFPLSL